MSLFGAPCKATNKKLIEKSLIAQANHQLSPLSFTG
jgi:hypothetical protein